MNARNENAHGEVGAGTSRNASASYHDPAAKILERLQKVRRTGAGRWIACCPAHDDRSPSLAVREADGGRVLIHCFGGCSVQEVVGALGLELGDLFPPRDVNHKPERRPFDAFSVLEAVSFELTVAGLILAQFVAGEPLDTQMRDRVALASGRVANALQVARGGHHHG
ncbi:CHC2 zinc finger domain-containing protein [Ferrovum sp.]|uniref:CHC2 zinc finger domain-containing protein n=1 Tax=Ferrovum sp. TaxID=2609467 RepID=UPI0026051E90|nr:CHC2 zinc finger domain-containing protein [Ferrovum sp.]